MVQYLEAKHNDRSFSELFNNNKIAIKTKSCLLETFNKCNFLGSNVKTHLKISIYCFVQTHTTERIPKTGKNRLVPPNIVKQSNWVVIFGENTGCFL